MTGLTGSTENPDFDCYRHSEHFVMADMSVIIKDVYSCKGDCLWKLFVYCQVHWLSNE